MMAVVAVAVGDGDSGVCCGGGEWRVVRGPGGK
jgi:hypothetical protein